MNEEQRRFIATTLNEILQDNAGNRITNTLVTGAIAIMDQQVQNKYPEQVEDEASE